MARHPAVNRVMARERVTLKDLAAELGLSVAAVSMALRNNREIAAATRERVKAKAAELGYRPDPTLRALADYRTRQRAAAARWNQVALVHDWPSVEAWHGHEFYRAWQRQLQAVAGEGGSNSRSTGWAPARRTPGRCFASSTTAGSPACSSHRRR